MGKVIVIDPGHGGWDPGATAADGRPEKEFNLELGLALRDALAHYDCIVLMTRTSDEALGSTPGADLHARAQLANHNGAELLVSLHHDAAPGHPDARGASLWIWTDRRDENGDLAWLPADGYHRAPRSYRIAQGIRARIQPALAALGVPWRGEIMCADFQVLRDALLPAVLLESFMGSHPEDVAAARAPGFIPALAEELAAGIAESLEIPRRPRTWDPVAEIRRARKAGLIDSDHHPHHHVTWGEFATVLNRLTRNCRSRDT